MMSAPTVDITNIDTTNLKPSDNTEVFREMVIISCDNMLKTAESSLKENPTLKKVIIMEHPKRFDTPDVDPVQLKHVLAKLANSTMNQLWLNSPLKDKISIGYHSLDDMKTHESNFRNRNTNMYDGVHFYGPNGKKTYTRSVMKMLQPIIAELINSPSQKYNKKLCSDMSKNDDCHTQCPETMFQKNYHKHGYHPSVQVKTGSMSLTPTWETCEGGIPVPP